MSTGDGYGRRWERNGEFCETVDPVTKTAGILTWSLKADRPANLERMIY